MIHKLTLIITLLFTSIFMQAQVLNPVTWTGDVEKLSDTEYNLIFNADIEEHWHLYSQDMPEGGALPTEFIYDSLSQINNYKLRSEEHTSELQSRENLVCRLLLEKKKI